MKPVRVTGWIDYETVERFAQAEQIIQSPIYQEAPYDQAHKDAIIKELIDKGYVICGDTHQISCIPWFEDGYILLSMRAWGELMAEVVNIVRHTNKYTYMDFYMASMCRFKEEYWEDDTNVQTI